MCKKILLQTQESVCKFTGVHTHKSETKLSSYKYQGVYLLGIVFPPVNILTSPAKSGRKLRNFNPSDVSTKSVYIFMMTHFLRNVLEVVY